MFRGYKTFNLLNLAEHENYSAHTSSLQCYIVLSSIEQLLRKMKLKNLVS